MRIKRTRRWNRMKSKRQNKLYMSSTSRSKSKSRGVLRKLGQIENMWNKSSHSHIVFGYFFFQVLSFVAWLNGRRATSINHHILFYTLHIYPERTISFVLLLFADSMYCTQLILVYGVYVCVCVWVGWYLFACTQNDDAKGNTIRNGDDRTTRRRQRRQCRYGLQPTFWMRRGERDLIHYILLS